MMKISNLRGFTVIETLIVVGILAIIVVVSTNLLFSSIGSSSKATVVAIVKQNGEHAISVMEREIRLADEADCPLPNQNVLTLYSEDGDEMVLDVQGSRIAVTDALGATTFLTSEQLDTLNFSCEVIASALPPDPDIVSVQFDLTISPGGNPNETFTETFQTRVSLRTY